MKTETTTGEYMLLFRGPHWDRGLTPDQLQQAMDKVMAWFEGLNEGGKIKSAQPLGAQGRIISGTNGRFVLDGPFAESKEAIGGYFYLTVADENEATAEAVERLMGSKPEARFAFIQERAPRSVELVDV